VGLNVSTEPGELPPPGPGALAATSLRIAGSAAQEREPLLTAILAGFERWYLAWRQAEGDPGRCGLRAEYTRLSGTIGRRVRAELPGGQVLSGLAVGLAEDGRLLVRVSPDAELPVAAGDVVHLR
ncbi:MAG: biotin--[acetyl-CoA-carboxylase] ligase, partial [Streptosporangiaceae bacterium]